MSFNFKGSDAKVERPVSDKPRVNFVEPGIRELQITKMELKTTTTGKKVIDVTCNELGTDRVIFRPYYLSTTMGPSGKKSAFDVSKESMWKLSVALGKKDTFEATEATSEEEFAHKMNALFMGSKFRNMVKGEITPGRNGSFTKSVMSDAFESLEVPAEKSRLSFDPTKHITDKTSSNQPSSQTSIPVSTDASGDDLPF